MCERRATGYTCEEFDALLPYFSNLFYERMQKYRLDGKPRGKRKYSDYGNSPLPTMPDKLFFILNYLKTNNLQTVQGAFFGLSQPKANQWLHTLHAVLNQTLASLGELPARQMETLEFEEEDKLYFMTAQSVRCQDRRRRMSNNNTTVVKKTPYAQKQCHD
jgi:hypothetical protein